MLHLVGVQKEFTKPRRARVIDDLHLAVAGGRVCLITGPVASGKTTLLRLAAGEIFADSGDVFVFGRELSHLRRSSLLALRRRVAWIPQEIRLLEEATVTHNIAVAAQAVGLSRKRATLAAIRAVENVGLEADADVPVRYLSTGQRRRVAVARGLVTEPLLILADEASGDLDAAGVSLLGDVFERAASRGAAIVGTTHDQRLHRLGRQRGWMLFRMVGGALEPDVRKESGEGAVIVPFPGLARAGGAES